MQTLPQKIISFLRAYLGGRDKKLQAARDKICNACDQFVEHPIKNMWGKWKMVGHCKACGCGMKSIADIRNGKNAMVKAACPEWKWPGDIKGKGLTLRDVNALFGARDRLEYNLATVQNNIDKGKPLDQAMIAQIYGQPPQQPATGNQKPAEGKDAAGAVAGAQPQRILAEDFDKTFRIVKNEQMSDQQRIAGGRAALAMTRQENTAGAAI
ncbi:MAG: hypothetical protein IID41_03045 [Planctomycetes bacterium]|nr:hypothetical protein [Planctomycetota bacterium]